MPVREKFNKQMDQREKKMESGQAMVRVRETTSAGQRHTHF